MNTVHLKDTILETILNNLEFSILVVDENYKILFCKDGKNFLGENLIGKNLNALRDKIGTKCFEILNKTKKTKKKVTEEYFVNGEEICLTCTPLINSKVNYGYLLCFKPGINCLINNCQEDYTYQNFYGIIGKSNEIQFVFQLIKRLADIDSTVLILGETGTGKELIAEAIHNSGKRRKKPLVKVNCSAITESLFESELFGAVKGAYTGAHKDRIGRIEKANGGTLFLDEIGDLPLNIQVKLLRFLQEKEFEKVGDSNTYKVDVRVIAATNRDLKKLVDEGKFRRDLFYRLNVFTIKVPPLRKRREDIPILTDYFVKFYCKKFNRAPLKISKQVKNFFKEYYWPGNIRELRHIIEYAVIMSKNDIIQPEDLPEDLHGYFKNLSDENEEKIKILEALEKVKWNKTEAAKLLGISRRTLYRKMSQYSIN